MTNSEKEYVAKLMAKVKERADGEKYIELPVAILNPYMYNTYKSELASAAGISVDELSALMQGESVLDTEHGKISAPKAGEADGSVLAFSVAVEWLLKKNSPQAVENYVMYELPVHNDTDLHDRYLVVLSRIPRYNRLLELGAPQMIIDNELRMLQKAVFELY